MGVSGFSSGPMGADRAVHNRLVLSKDSVWGLLQRCLRPDAGSCIGSLGSGAGVIAK